MKDYYTTNSHYIAHTLLFTRLGECTFELGSERVNHPLANFNNDCDVYLSSLTTEELFTEVNTTESGHTRPENKKITTTRN